MSDKMAHYNRLYLYTILRRHLLVHCIFNNKKWSINRNELTNEEIKKSVLF